MRSIFMITWRRAARNSQDPKIQAVTCENVLLRAGGTRAVGECPCDNQSQGKINHRLAADIRRPRRRSVRVPIMAAIITAMGAVAAAAVAGAFNLFG